MGLDGTAPPASRAAIAGETALETAKNLVALLPGFRRARTRRPRSSPGEITDEWVNRNAFRTLDYVTRVGVSVEGLDVAEIGVGDSVASGIAFLAAGARSFTAVDPYLGDIGTARNLRISTAVWRAWTLGRQRAWPPGLAVDGAGAAVSAVRAPIETVEGAELFDLICSVSAVEHVWELDKLGPAIRRLLRPEGVALHWVDLGAHGRWTRFEDQLTFLRVPDVLWRAGRARGLPTRLRLNELVEILRGASLKVDVEEVGQFPASQLPHDTRLLAHRFRSLPTDALTASSALLRITRSI